MLILLLVINSQKSIVDQYVFYMLEGFYIYWFLFVLGYAVAIMRNCVDLILLREDIVENEKNKSLYDTANELRIDILLEVLYNNASSQEMHDNLLKIIDNRIDMMDRSDKQKDKLRKYLHDYYKLPIK